MGRITAQTDQYPGTRNTGSKFQKLHLQPEEGLGDGMGRVER